jgi:aspartyl-tRNA(Asn)/glutamyl-tRNA(Gln) amidotransferase subunit B
MKVSSEVLAQYEVVVGLEIHAQLNTRSKIFSPDATRYGQEPNTQISAITLAHPGTLPKLNRAVLAKAIRMGLACGSRIAQWAIFDRKNYFYPDLPKGYQLTQDRTPICQGGQVRIRTKDGQQRLVQLHHIHLEEDAGKSIHLDDAPETCIDLNRAGTPLVEIVSDPCLHSGEEAYAYLAEVRRLVRFLDICDGNMEEGSLRADANISVRPKGSTRLGSKVEVKNMNSMRNVQRAVDHEFERQVGELLQGREIPSETRTFNAHDGSTASMRLKETLNDYRYFPDPDLPPVLVSDEELAAIEAGMPALPWALFDRLVGEMGLPEHDALVLTDSRESAAYFLEACAHTPAAKAVSNWLMGPVRSWLNEQGAELDRFPLAPARLAQLADLTESQQVSFAVAAQQLFPQLLEAPEQEPLALAQRLSLLQNSDDGFIRPIVEQVLDANPDKVKAFLKGKKNLQGFFMGEVMKASKGQVAPQKASELVLQALEARK